MTAGKHIINSIRDIPRTLKTTLESNKDAVQLLVNLIRSNDLRRIIITSNGSSYTASLMAAPLLRCFCTIPVHVLPSTELEVYARLLVDNQTLVIAVSRSGEREWVVKALEAAVDRGARGVVMTGNKDSLLAQKGQVILLTSEGPEVAFAKTKSVVACAGLLMLLGLLLAIPGSYADEATRLLRQLHSMYAAIERELRTLEPLICDLVSNIKGYDAIVVGGTNSNYGVALEAAIKIPEAAGVMTLANHTGDILHGPPLSRNCLLMLLIMSSDLDLSVEVLRLARTFGAHRLTISEPGIDVSPLSDYALTLPDQADPLLAGLLYLPSIQLLTCYLALARGINPDSPPFMKEMLDAILPKGREEPEMRKRGPGSKK